MTSDPISTIAASLSLARSLRVETDYRLRFESPARPWERTTRPGLAGAASTNQKPGLVRMRGADQWEIVRLLLLNKEETVISATTQLGATTHTSLRMLLDFSNDPVMVHKHVIGDSDEDREPGEDGGDLKSGLSKYPGGGSISEYDSNTSDEEQLSQASECVSEGTKDRTQEEFHEELHEIREVWAHNLAEEFREICHLVQKYPFVAMDTEFPGIVAKPVGSFSSADEYKYQLVKCNVDLLKLIQLGITLFDGSGNLPKGVCTWQFNFKFNLMEDLYAEDSIHLLRTSGLDFEKHSYQGVEPCDFAELLLSSGLVLLDTVTWITFHSAYDFGYLLAQLTAGHLPESEGEFLETLKIYFPNLYDIKYLMLSTDNLMGGLQSVANKLKVKRIGCQHQAGSDSLLTGQVFFKIYDKYFSETGLDDVKYSGQICGFNSCMPAVTTASGSSAIVSSDPLYAEHETELVHQPMQGSSPVNSQPATVI